MAKANKVKLPNGSYVSINDERIHIYRSLTGTAAVTSSPYTHAKWDVADSTITEYVDGMVVCVKVPVAGNGTYGTALQINSLGYKPVVYNVNSMVSTRYGVGAIVWAVYNATQTASLYVNSASASTITGCWQVMDYDSNTTSIYTLQRYNGTRVVSADLLRYVIAFRKNETTIVPIHSVAGTGTSANTAVTSTNKTMTTESFDPFGEIYQYATNTKIAANESVNLSTLRTQCASVDARYIFNCNKTLTAQRELYLVVDLQSDGMVKLATSVNPWAQTLPSTNDGHLYILLGYAYSAYQMELYYYHPIYYHDGTQLRQYGGDKTFSGNYNDLTNKPTIPDAVSGQNDGTNWTSLTIGNTTKAIPQGGGLSTLSGLTDTTISSPTDGQMLKYDNATSKWVNGDVPTEVLYCTLTYTVTYDSETELYSITSTSCDKTEDEIYAAYAAKKHVLLKTTTSDGIDHSWDVSVPEVGTVFELFQAMENSGTPNTHSFVFKSLYGGTLPLVIPFMQSNTSMISDCVIIFNSASNSTFGQLIGTGWIFREQLIGTNTLTIQKNGTTVDTFVAGSNTNATIDITVPTSSNDLSDINVSSPSGGQILKYNSTSSKWENANETTELPSITGNANKVLAVNNGATGVEWVTKPSSGLTDYDFTHAANTTIVSGSEITVTFAADQRGSAMLTISADLGLTIACNNGGDNYIWIKNSGSADVDVTISAVTKNSTAVSNVYVPSDGITVPAGGVCEIGVIVNADGAFITSRNDLAL